MVVGWQDVDGYRSRSYCCTHLHGFSTELCRVSLHFYYMADRHGVASSRQLLAQPTLRPCENTTARFTATPASNRISYIDAISGVDFLCPLPLRCPPHKHLPTSSKLFPFSWSRTWNAPCASTWKVLVSPWPISGLTKANSVGAGLRSATPPSCSRNMARPSPPATSSPQPTNIASAFPFASSVATRSPSIANSVAAASKPNVRSSATPCGSPSSLIPTATSSISKA